jgi:Multicopper oxidase
MKALPRPETSKGDGMTVPTNEFPRLGPAGHVGNPNCVTNVGRWMAHCHIAEHHERGMMFSFEVRA